MAETSLSINALKITRHDCTSLLDRLCLETPMETVSLCLEEHILFLKDSLLVVNRGTRLRAGLEKRGSRSQRKACLAPPSRRRRQESGNDGDDGHDDERSQNHNHNNGGDGDDGHDDGQNGDDNNGDDNSEDGQGSEDPPKPPGVAELKHNQRIPVSVKSHDGTDVPLFAIVRFDVKRSFINERVIRDLYLEVHPIPLWETSYPSNSS